MKNRGQAVRRLAFLGVGFDSSGTVRPAFPKLGGFLKAVSRSAKVD
jgi:hypothetical protein